VKAQQPGANSRSAIASVGDTGNPVFVMFSPYPLPFAKPLQY